MNDFEEQFLSGGLDPDADAINDMSRTFDQSQPRRSEHGLYAESEVAAEQIRPLAEERGYTVTIAQPRRGLWDVTVAHSVVLMIDYLKTSRAEWQNLLAPIEGASYGGWSTGGDAEFGETLEPGLG